jgi:hypothetical protein
VIYGRRINDMYHSFTLDVLEYLGELDTYYPQLRKNPNKKQPLQKVVRVNEKGGLAAMMISPQSVIMALRPRYCVILYSADVIPTGSIQVHISTNGKYINFYYVKEIIVDEIALLKEQIAVLTTKMEELSKKL